MNKDNFIKEVEKLGIEIDGIKLNQLEKYYKMLIEYNKVMNLTKITEKEEQWLKGEIDLQEVSNFLYEKSDWTIEYKQYTETDIKAKKGSYKHWLDKIQLDPQNRINQHAVRYMLFFFTTLMEEYNFGKERLTKVEEYMNNLLLEYQQNKTTVHEWHKALLDEAGICIEMPIDPLTQTSGSVMTGQC